MTPLSAHNYALITGAASGVGLGLAKMCVSKTMGVILVDNNKEELEKAYEVIESLSKGPGVHRFELDVSSLAAWQNLRDNLAKQSLRVDVLFLNAGIAPKGDWTDNSHFHSIFDVNFFGVVNGLNTFLPDFQDGAPDAKERAIVITGSKQGITNPPGNPAYNASKAALRSLAEHLSFDLAKSAPKTSVHLLVPGWTWTGLTSGGSAGGKDGGKRPAGCWTGEQVASFLYDRIIEGRFYIICPDNDVDWDTDRRRMLWSAGDIVHQRQPLSRWRAEYKDEAAETMAGYDLPPAQQYSAYPPSN